MSNSLASNYTRLNCINRHQNTKNSKSSKCLCSKTNERDISKVPFKKHSEISRREMNLGSSILITTTSLFISTTTQPAYAIFGIGGNPNEAYKNKTETVIKLITDVLEVPGDDPKKETLVKDVRKEVNEWVAAYRRDNRFAGKPSYNNTYSVINAITGHYNSFGIEAPIPKKRLDRISKELADASLFLSKGR